MKKKKNKNPFELNKGTLIIEVETQAGAIDQTIVELDKPMPVEVAKKETENMDLDKRKN